MTDTPRYSQKLPRIATRIDHCARFHHFLAPDCCTEHLREPRVPFELQLSGRGPKFSRANYNTLPPQIELPSAAYVYLYTCTVETISNSKRGSTTSTRKYLICWCVPLTVSIGITGSGLKKTWVWNCKRMIKLNEFVSQVY